ncbi:hypothetical protein [Rhizohabitans arisaemae]|uniref:hypothetical protein n=1 Tax=Rhizohabitans arisaemae TaxID=2720610 RepID=UPI0024B2141B|nr:hypothetical protein [Rhizohabitans arisaemae]
MDLDLVCGLAGRDAKDLTRRDVAKALLCVPSGRALVAVPTLRRELLAVGNPLSAAFWDSTRTILAGIESGVATVGEVHRWLEATGTEPITLVGMFVWPDEGERGPVATEFHALLVEHLEGLVRDGVVDPDRLAVDDPVAKHEYFRLQDEWLQNPLPDGRVPAHKVMDEQDEELLAAYDEEESFALAELRRILAELPGRLCPRQELDAAAVRLRALFLQDVYPSRVLLAAAGLTADELPEDNEAFWLALVSGLISPIDDIPEDEDTLLEFVDLEGELSLDDQAMATLCSIQHANWLGAVAALTRNGPGTPASPAEIARMIGESEDIEGFYEGVEDEAAEADLFTDVVFLWEVLGVVDRSERLTPLGWWGLPEAAQRAWTGGEL